MGIFKITKGVQVMKELPVVKLPKSNRMWPYIRVNVAGSPDTYCSIITAW